MRLSSSRLGVLACGFVLAISLASSACDGNNEAQLGDRCFVTTDCAPGLVCIPSGENGSGTTCSNNLDGIQKEPTKPGGEPMTSGGAPGDGGSSGAPGDGGSSSSSSGGETSSSSGGETSSSSSSSGGSSSSSASSSSSSSSSSGAPDGGDDDAG